MENRLAVNSGRFLSCLVRAIDAAFCPNICRGVLGYRLTGAAKMNMRSMLRCRPAAVVTIVVSVLSAGAAVAVGPASAATSACSPVITSVSSLAAAQTQTVTITGSCLGTAASQTAADTPDLRITDLSAEPIWNGCHDGTGDNDSVGCTITSWTNTSITFA